MVRNPDVALLSLSLSLSLSLLRLAGCLSIQLPLRYELLRKGASTNFKFIEDLEIRPCSLVEWLHETYFDNEKNTYFTEAEIQAAGDLLQSMMQYRPSNRPRASQLLNHRWFRNNRFEVQEAQSYEASSS